MHRGGKAGLLAIGLVFLCACYQSFYPPQRKAVTRGSHDEFFVINQGSHTAQSCDDCHGGLDSFAKFDCLRCHPHNPSDMARAHSAVAGYDYNSSQCLKCHPRGEAMSRSAHNSYFPIEDGRHGRTTCAECHPGGSSRLNCFDCHSHTCAAMSGEHDEVRSFSCDDRLCYQCHPRGYAEDD